MTSYWLRPLCAGILALTSLLAHAQYSWIDDKGVRVFSDRPPPPGTPAARILKTPRGLAPADRSAQPEARTASTPAQPGWVQREEEYKKRSAEREKAEKEADAKRKAANTADCASAGIAQAQLNSGTRLVRVNKHGEKEYLSDEERERESDKARRTLAACR